MEDLFKLVVKSFTFPIWIKDSNCRFIYVNDVYASGRGKKVEDFIGKCNEDIFDEETCKLYRYHLEEVKEKMSPVVKSLYINNRYNQCTIIPLIEDGLNIKGFVGVIGILNDEGKIKEKDMEIEMQKNLTKQIIDILPGDIFYKDVNSRYVYANKGCREFYRKRGIDNIIGKTDRDINKDINQVTKFQQDDKFIIETRKNINNEAVFEDEHGRKSYREVVKVPLIDSNGNVTGIVGRAIDITKRKLYEERLNYLSYTDILTGANNRAYFEEFIEELSDESNLPLGIIMGDSNGLKVVNDTFGHLEGDVLLRQIVKVMKDVCQEIGEVFRFGGDEFVIVIPHTTMKECERIIKKIQNKCNEYENELLTLSISLGAAIKNYSYQDIYEVLKEAEDKVYRQKLSQKKSIKSSILDSLKIALAAKSIETELHTERVSELAIRIGEILDLEMSQIDEIKIVADLHDIGKIGISEEILLKTGPLTEQEYNVMKTHSEKGYRIVKASSELNNIAQGVLCHHERWDGTGYPLGLKGEDIPLVSRIISIADAYDVMTNYRTYKSAMDYELALEEIKKCSGTQFDPNIVKVFIDNIKEYYIK